MKMKQAHEPVWRSMGIYAKLLGAAWKIQVLMDPSVPTACCSRDTVRVRPLDLGSQEDACLLEGLIDHEAGVHARRTDFDVADQLLEGRPTIVRRIANVLEDVWGERELYRERPGCARTINSALQIMQARGLYQEPTGPQHPAAALHNMLLFGLRTTRLGQQCLAPGAVSHRNAANQAFGPTRVAAIWSLAEEIDSVRSTKEAIELAERIVKLACDEHQDASGNASGQDSDDSEGDQDQDASGNAGGQDTDDSEGDQDQDSSGNASGQDSDDSEGDQDQDASGNASGQDSDDSDGDQDQDASGNASGQDSDDSDGEQDQGASGNASGQDSDDSDGEQDQGASGSVRKQLQGATEDDIPDGDLAEGLVRAMSPDAAPPHPSAGGGAGDQWSVLRQEPYPDPGKAHQLESLAAPIRIRLGSKLDAYLTTRVDTASESARRGRRLEGRLLPQIRMSGRTRVFRKTEDEEGIDTAISILTDISGSMSDAMEDKTTCIDAATATTRALGDTLQRFDLPFAINFFGASLVTAKRFGDRWATTRCNLYGALQWSTVTHQAVAAVLPEIWAQPQARKLLILITDGAPSDARRTVAALEEARRAGIECLALLLTPSEHEPCMHAFATLLEQSAIPHVKATNTTAIATSIFDAVQLTTLADQP